jgi:hypothetical protein
MQRKHLAKLHILSWKKISKNSGVEGMCHTTTKDIHGNYTVDIRMGECIGKLYI